MGVDCIPAKTCTLDCIYCECGATTNRTMERKEYVPASAIIAELTFFLKDKPRLDFITFGGGGEPTLNSEIGRVVRFLKRDFPDYKTALLTNGTLLSMPEVREAILPFDCVLPSLDAVSAGVFMSVNRPHGGLDVNLIVEGLIAFSKQYTGIVLMEVFIVPGINDTPGELALFKDALLRINPTRVQLNSLDRPGTVASLKPAPQERLREIAAYLAPLPVEIIARDRSIAAGNAAGDAEATVLSTVRRRPLTIEEISSLTGMTINDCSAILKRMGDEGKIASSVVNNKTFYRVPYQRDVTNRDETL